MEPCKCTQDEGVERPVLHNASHELGSDKSVDDHENVYDDEQNHCMEGFNLQHSLEAPAVNFGHALHHLFKYLLVGHPQQPGGVSTPGVRCQDDS